MGETVIVERRGEVAILTLNRPKQMNALNTAIQKELAEQIDEISIDKGLKAVVITGGEKAFAAGADLAEVNGMETLEQFRAFIASAQGLFFKIEEMPKPVIAAVNGLAYGGGCELACACDLRIAGQSARFAVPEINLGLIPGAGGTYRLPKLLGLSKGKEMLFTGEPIDALEGYRLGLVNKVVADDQVLDEALALAKRLCSKPINALKMAKLTANKGAYLDYHTASDLEAQCIHYLFTTQDREEGVKAFVEKRKPLFTGN